METSEILKKVRRIEIKTRGLSNNIFAGQYHSAFIHMEVYFLEHALISLVNAHFLIVYQHLFFYFWFT